MNCEAGKNPQDHDKALPVLEYVHSLIANPETAVADPRHLLESLGKAFAADAAGLWVIGIEPLLRIPKEKNPAEVEWVGQPDFLGKVRASRTPLTHVVPHGTALVASVGLQPWANWLIWVEGPSNRVWTPAEAGALLLAGQAIQNRANAGAGKPERWIGRMQRVAIQQYLDAGAEFTRRVAHAYGNVFTGLQGFSELSIGRPAPKQAVLEGFLKEILESCHKGVRLTDQLRQFANRSQVNEGRTTSLRKALEQQHQRLDAIPEHHGKLRSPPRLDGLPEVALSADHLRMVLTALLDNAAEATPKREAIEVEVDVVVLDRAEGFDYLGKVQAGPHVRLLIRDFGPGMTPDQWNKVLVELFFTTKPRHRGLGLAVAHGILCVNRGGLVLRPGLEKGVEVELVLPVAPGRELSPGDKNAAAKPRGGKAD